MLVADAVEQWALENRPSLSPEDKDRLRLVWSTVRRDETGQRDVDSMTDRDFDAALALFDPDDRSSAADMLDQVVAWARRGQPRSRARAEGRPQPRSLFDDPDEALDASSAGEPTSPRSDRPRPDPNRRAARGQSSDESRLAARTAQATHPDDAGDDAPTRDLTQRPHRDQAEPRDKTEARDNAERRNRPQPRSDAVPGDSTVNGPEGKIDRQSADVDELGRDAPTRQNLEPEPEPEPAGTSETSRPKKQSPKPASSSKNAKLDEQKAKQPKPKPKPKAKAKAKDSGNEETGRRSAATDRPTRQDPTAKADRPEAPPKSKGTSSDARERGRKQTDAENRPQRRGEQPGRDDKSAESQLNEGTDTKNRDTKNRDRKRPDRDGQSMRSDADTAVAAESSATASDDSDPAAGDRTQGKRTAGKNGKKKKPSDQRSRPEQGEGRDDRSEREERPEQSGSATRTGGAFGSRERRAVPWVVDDLLDDDFFEAADHEDKPSRLAANKGKTSDRAPKLDPDEHDWAADADDHGELDNPAAFAQKPRWFARYGIPIWLLALFIVALLATVVVAVLYVVTG